MLTLNSRKAINFDLDDRLLKNIILHAFIEKAVKRYIRFYLSTLTD